MGGRDEAAPPLPDGRGRRSSLELAVIEVFGGKQSVLGVEWWHSRVGKGRLYGKWGESSPTTAGVELEHSRPKAGVWGLGTSTGRVNSKTPTQS